MVIKGLKVGDVFEDGGLFYVVDKIVGSGYISHNVTKEQAAKRDPSIKKYTEKQGL